MTDKQIIEHKLLYEGLDWSVGVDGMFINPKQIPYTNCLYELALACDSKSKQLKAKEQECEKWKNAYEVKEDALAESEEYCEELEEQLEAYKMEAEEGKEINAELKAENEEFEETVNNLIKVQYGLADRCTKYSQALTEIKEIANKFDYWNNNLSQASEILHEIIEKISEVLDE